MPLSRSLSSEVLYSGVLLRSTLLEYLLRRVAWGAWPDAGGQMRGNLWLWRPMGRRESAPYSSVL